ncbi:peroxiredoxin-5, mitochondrial [Platysternon megacephalum]|uniref:Peroxiredoxin-5, mitochondrial n=1 Tax=Platysternon megacephalum TaxID=55544 RepID=A0A4D9ENV3_9SAUR|nr:peroxiredoxin-5, mitochondrial [Platysternon megacephalum]
MLLKVTYYLALLRMLQNSLGILLFQLSNSAQNSCIGRLCIWSTKTGDGEKEMLSEGPEERTQDTQIKALCKQLDQKRYSGGLKSLDMCFQGTSHSLSIYL